MASAKPPWHEDRALYHIGNFNAISRYLPIYYFSTKTAKLEELKISMPRLSSLKRKRPTNRRLDKILEKTETDYYRIRNFGSYHSFVGRKRNIMRTILQHSAVNPFQSEKSNVTRNS